MPLPARCLVLLALALTALAADAAPLPEAGPLHAAVVHALTRFAQGDAADLLALPEDAFATPPALADPERPGLRWRWTLLIPWDAPAVRHLGEERIATLRTELARRGVGGGRDAAWPASAECSPAEPGLPLALPDPPALAAGPLRLAAGHLLALRDGLPAWQLALEPGTRTWLGADAALIADGAGLRWIGLDGVLHRMPPLPAEVSVLGTAGGAAFFHQDGRAWRLALGAPGADGVFPADRPATIELGDEPLGPPLAGDRACLWLTMHALVRWDGRTARSFRHGLPAGRGWRLARDAAGRALILAPGHGAWLVPDRVPGDADEALGRFADLERRPDLSRAQRFRAALRHHDWPTARTLAGDALDLAALALYADQAPPPGTGELAPLPLDPGELILPAAGWSGGVVPRARPDPAPAPAPGRDRTRPLAEAAEPWPEAEPPARTRDGLALGARTWLVADDGVRAEATCRDDGALRWFARWLPEPGLAAPARALALLDDHLLVGEGDARLLAFAAGTGAPELDLRPRRVPVLPGRTWLRLRPDGIAGAIVLHPPGIDDRLGWLGDGGERDERLPARARWLLALPDGERWLALVDGGALRCSDLAGAAAGAWQPLQLPAALIASDAPPHLVDGGIAADGKRWRWRKAGG